MRVHRILDGVEVPVAGGLTLRADVWLPDGDGPFPVLLQRTPYGRTDPFGSQYIVGMDNLRALERGFALVVQDTRGRYGSDGDFIPYVHEAADGAATVAWLREQPWSDGRVATYGASYVGATQLLLAGEGAEGHVAMAPLLTAGDFHSGWTYSGGALQLGFLWLWILESLGPADADHAGLPAGHPVRAHLAAMARDPRAAMAALPLRTAVPAEVAPYLEEWLAHPVADEFWAANSADERAADVRAAGLHIVGQHDLFCEASLRTYARLRDLSPAPQRLVLGPWSHGNLTDWQGEEWLGYAADAGAFDLPGAQLEFFSAALDGREPALAPVTYFVTGANEWCEAESWPPPTARTQTWHFVGGSGLATEPSPGSGLTSWKADPSDPVPSVGGQTFLPGLLSGRASGPKDVGFLAERADVVQVLGPVLAEPLRLAGPVTLHLSASTTAEDCDWVGRLVEARPDGSVVQLAESILRARYRHGGEAVPLTPHRIETFTVPLGTVAHELAPGSRLGLQLASSSFPRFDRNPQSLVDPVDATPDDFVVATHTVCWGGPHASSVEVTLLPPR
ncbi:CocE/NonD family hydrolase [Nocardioides sp. GY 10127]|uniref:CocE/NonD family hydrolase n=1 Tax=Nocardioides sp. GY 10127 TaxID=2569762 RepID=UPI0010A77E61|nr:CocE/NonD family hydrolase [Nocardioides sp. GY 10127]TIC79459.1 CocE/NonD family hydrolase [Nocardioides sp. GY 10127]